MLTSRKVSGLEAAACIVLALVLNKRIRDENMDRASVVAMVAGGIAGILADGFILHAISEKQPEDSEIADYIGPDELFAGFLLVLMSSLSFQAVRHAAPLIFREKRVSFAITEDEEAQRQLDERLINSPTRPRSPGSTPI